MLVSVNVLTPFSYAGLENELWTSENSGIILKDEPENDWELSEILEDTEIILETGTKTIDNTTKVFEYKDTSLELDEVVNGVCDSGRWDDVLDSMWDENLEWWKWTKYDANHIDAEYARMDGKNDLPGYFTEKTSDTSESVATLLPWQEFNQTIKRLAWQSGANYSKYNETIEQILQTWSMPSWVTTWLVSVDGSIPVIAWYIGGIIYLTTEADIIYLNEDSSYMFYGLSSVTKIDTTKWDTSNVTDMSYMFRYCSSLTGLDVSSWNTSSVTTMLYMFYGCSNLTELDVNNWNTSSVTLMDFMFSGCGGLTGLDVSNWDTSSMASMVGIFYYCSNLTGLDLSNWNTSNVTSMDGLFGECSSLETIYANTWFVTTAVTSSAGMFDGDTNLVWWNGTTYDANHINAEYARIDGKNDLPGYFTEKTSDTSESVAILLPWEEFNIKVKKLAGDVDADVYYYENESVIKILQRTWDSIPSWVVTWLLSDSTSTYPVYGWFDNWTIYYYTQAEKIYLNEDSSTMFATFRGLLELDIADLDVSNVVDISQMFQGCSSLTWLDVGDWDMGNVEDMWAIFAGCDNLVELDVSRWDTSNVTSMLFVFEDCWNLRGLDVSRWDTSNVTNMSSMFQNCGSLTWLDLSNWDTSKVTDMGSMFFGCNSLESLNVSNWDVGKVENMSAMFSRCNNLIWLDVSNRNVGNVEDMHYMFNNCGSLTWLDVSNWNVSNVKNMSSMFQGCRSLTWLDVSNWNIGGVENMSSMFYSCRSLRELDLSSWDTTNVKFMPFMFGDCINLTTIYASSKFNISGLEYGSGMFYDASNLVWWNGTKYDANYTDFRYARIDGVNGLSWYFTKGTATLLHGIWFNEMLKSLAGSDESIIQILYTWSMPVWAITWIVSTSWSSLPVVAWYKDGIVYIVTEADKIYLNEDSSGMFGGLEFVTKIDTTNWDTSKVTNMSDMFFGCSGLNELDVSNWDTSKVESMSDMFNNCGSLTWLDVSNWDTSKVESMSDMFFGCSSLEKLDVNNWNTTSLIEVWQMFEDCSSLTWFDLNNWNTSKVTDMTEMFAGCTNLRELKVANWDTSNVKHMSYMFLDCDSLENLDLTNWDTSNVKYMYKMFAESDNLKTIYISTWFVTTSVTESEMMFSGAIKLVWWNGTTYDANHIDAEYAKIDRQWQTWYFTDKNAITVKFISNIDGSQSTVVVSKWQKLTLPVVNGYDAIWWYSDSVMTKQINLENWVEEYTEIYVKYEHKPSGWWGGWGWSSGGWWSSSSNKNTNKNSTGNVLTWENGKINTWKNISVITWSNDEIKDSLVDIDKSQKNNSQNWINSQKVSGYSEEMVDAYNFAYKNWITTMSNIENAKMYKGLTRIAMAKMLSQYAINVLWKNPDKSRNIKFNDVSDKMDKDYNYWVTLAYQLWIMWVNMKNNNFRPNDTITRAEFVTALSRLLYDTPDGNPYYVTHMQKLKERWIILNDNPKMKESRWYVMIMLMRSANLK